MSNTARHFYLTFQNRTGRLPAPRPGMGRQSGMTPAARILVCGTMIVGLSCPIAHADTPARKDGHRQPPAPKAATKNPQAQGVETVMVTANRRSQDIQKVAGTVTAISAQTIAREHLDSASDVAAFAPNALGYNFDGRLRPRYYIRGVGNGNQANNAVGAVAVY
ncbi:hypothetical protein HLH44_21420, partial [Gluconacetobacter sp. 1c LMG 22058]|nr:hypothetical protein [Gluconacetobacter dulcium]